MTIFSFLIFFIRYGIGAIYQKQERYELAEMHYKRALRINHSSALIMCHIAVVRIRYFSVTVFNVWIKCAQSGIGS